MTDVQPLLDRVADELRTHGWCQRRYEDLDGRHCLAGALRKLWPAGFDAEWTAARHAIEDRIGIEYLTDWNDTRGRTLEQVLALLAPR